GLVLLQIARVALGQRVVRLHDLLDAVRQRALAARRIGECHARLVLEVGRLAARVAVDPGPRRVLLRGHGDVDLPVDALVARERRGDGAAARHPPIYLYAYHRARADP